MHASILKKTLMALTGLALVGFLIAHLLGNLLFFAGPEVLDRYAQTLENNPMLVVPAEIGLFFVFILHLYLGIRLSLENKAARSTGYEVHHNQSGLSSRAMLITGLFTLVFIVLHVWMFKFGDTAKHDDSLWALAIDWFQKPLVTLGYVVAMFFLGLHLHHAIASIFQSLGLVKPGKRSRLQQCGRLLGWALVLGFASIPLWALIFNPKPRPKPAIEQPLKDTDIQIDLNQLPKGARETIAQR